MCILSLQHDWECFRQVAALDLPLHGVEVVGAVTEVLNKYRREAEPADHCMAAVRQVEE